jgi:hypothetical protein
MNNAAPAILNPVDHAPEIIKPFKIWLRVNNILIVKVLSKDLI